MRVPNVLSSSIKLMIFPFSLEGAAQIWLEKEPSRSILTWDDLVTKFINQFFPPSKTINLRNEITRFQQRFDESFYEAWNRFNDLLRACPHHGFSELYQLDTFYNALNVNDHDSLNSAAGGNFLDKMPRECLKIIESKSKVRQSRAKAVVAKVSTSSSTPAISSEVAELKDMVRTLLLDKKNQSSAPAHSPTPAPVKQLSQIMLLAVVLTRTKIVPLPAKTFIEKTSKSMCHKPPQLITTKETPVSDLRWLQIKFDLPVFLSFEPIKIIKTISIGGTISIKTEVGQNLQIQMANLTDMLSKFMSSNTASSSGPTIPTSSKVVKQRIEVTKDQVQTLSSQSTAPVQPPVVQSETQTPVSEPIVAPVSAPIPNLKPSIHYLLRRNNERRRDQANEQIEKFYKIFKDMKKLSEMARTPMNENCSAVILNKLPRKLRDLGKFLILCEFPGMDECLALADLGASINLMPLFVWEGLSLLKLTPTCMTLELADRSVSKPIDIAKDVSVKVGVFHFPADFVVVDFKPDPRVPLILGRCFLKIDRALIDVHKVELTLRIGNETITYNLDQTFEILS
nr:reverse transcriptase domain-containing protein [Tanacetum cinerariifolium]